METDNQEKIGNMETDNQEKIGNMGRYNQRKELLLSLHMSLYLEILKIREKYNYKNAQEFIREAIREKLKKEGI